MPDTNTRIEQFRKMTAEDPENELGHFSLGRAYLDAGLHEEAIASFRRAIGLNGQMARAYQYIALALLKKGDREAAVEYLSKGIHIAHGRGDTVPQEEMRRALEELGVAAPELAKAEASRALGGDEVFCRRCGRIGRKLGSPPFRNARGREIQERICVACWGEWVAMGTKVINELHLALADVEAQKVFEQHMREFLDLEGP